MANIYLFRDIQLLSLITFLFCSESVVEELQVITSEVVEKSQTGELSSSLNLPLDVISVTEPEPEPVAPPKATNETGKKIQRNICLNVVFRKVQISGGKNLTHPKSAILVFISRLMLMRPN